jgi:hypothetical protein
MAPDLGKPDRAMTQTASRPKFTAEDPKTTRVRFTVDKRRWNRLFFPCQ